MIATRGFVAAPPSRDRVPWWLIAIFTVVLIVACVHQACKDIAAAIRARRQ